MKAFHNDPLIRKKYLARIRAHAKADEFVKGKYWENGKGCAVGCTIHDSDHARYETELGLPEWLARVEDTIFEGLPNDKAKAWPVQFLEAANLGADLNQIKAPFMIYVLEQARLNFDRDKYDYVDMVICQVITLWEDDPNQENKDAWSAAESAAAWAAAWAAAESAARSAAWSARSAESAAAESAEQSAAYPRFAEKLLELMRECGAKGDAR